MIDKNNYYYFDQFVSLLILHQVLKSITSFPFINLFIYFFPGCFHEYLNVVGGF